MAWERYSTGGYYVLRETGIAATNAATGETSNISRSLLPPNTDFLCFLKTHQLWGAATGFADLYTSWNGTTFASTYSLWAKAAGTDTSGEAVVKPYTASTGNAPYMKVVITASGTNDASGKYDIFLTFPTGTE